MTPDFGETYRPDKGKIEETGGSRLEHQERDLTEAQELANELYDIAKGITTEVSLDNKEISSGELIAARLGDLIQFHNQADLVKTAANIAYINIVKELAMLTEGIADTDRLEEKSGWQNETDYEQFSQLNEARQALVPFTK